MQILKLKIKLESGQEVELTLEEAKNLYDQLSGLFEKKEDSSPILPVPTTPFPYQPQTPVAPENPYWTAPPWTPNYPTFPYPTYPIITCQVTQ